MLFLLFDLSVLIAFTLILFLFIVRVQLFFVLISQSCLFTVFALLHFHIHYVA